MYPQSMFLAYPKNYLNLSTEDFQFLQLQKDLYVAWINCSVSMTVQFYSNAEVQQGDHLSPLLFLSYIRGRHAVKEALMAQLVLEIDNNKVGENKQI